MPATRKLSAYDLTCPKGKGETHQFTEVMDSIVCILCCQTVQQVVETTPLLHDPVPCTCWPCSFTQVRRCGTCHLDINVHAKNFL